jgi:hypothetical protein
LRLADNTGATIAASAPISLLSGAGLSGWQRLVLISPAALTNGATYRLYVETDVQQALTFLVDGAQAEAKPVPTPYVHTVGATASRTAARVQAPAAYLDETKGWVAVKLRMGFASGDDPGYNPRVFRWGDSASNQLLLTYRVSDDKWVLTRTAAGVVTEVASAAQTFARGEVLTVIAAWTGTQLAVSVNGAAFASAASTTIPTLAAALFDIGGENSGSQISSEILWFGSGAGDLTDADAATTHGVLLQAGVLLSSTEGVSPEPTAPDFVPAAAAPTMLWTAQGPTPEFPLPRGDVTVTKPYGVFGDLSLSCALAEWQGPGNTTGFQISAGVRAASVHNTSHGVAFDSVHFRPGKPPRAHDYTDGDQDNCRWAGAAHASRSYRGGPYYPNVLPMRRVRVTAPIGNLAPDPSFEQNALTSDQYSTTLPWCDFGSTSVVRENVAGAHGSWRLKAARASGNQGATVKGTLTADSRGGAGTFRCAGGQNFVVSLNLMKDVGGVNPEARLRVDFYDNAGTKLGGIDPGNIDAAFRYNPPEGTWGRFQLTGLAPESATRAQIWLELIRSGGVTGAVTVYADAVQFEHGIGSTVFSSAPGEVTMFTGHVERWPQQSESHRRGTVTITAVDGFEPLRQAEIRGELVQVLSGARINRLLDYIGFPGGDRRVIDAGQTTVCKVVVKEEDAQKADSRPSVLAHVLDVAQTELGLFFIDGPGRAVNHDSLHRSTSPHSTIVQLTLGDGGPAAGEYPFLHLVPDYDIERVSNDIRVTRTAVEGEAVAPVEQVAADGISQAHYYRRTLSRTTMHTTDAAAKTYAQALLAKLKDAKLEFRQVAFDPAVDPDGFLWRAAINSELSDRVRIRRRPQQVGGVLERECFVEAITHRCTLGTRRSWLTTWDLSPAT